MGLAALLFHREPGTLLKTVLHMRKQTLMVYQAVWRKTNAQNCVPTDLLAKYLPGWAQALSLDQTDQELYKYVVLSILPRG